MGYDTFSVDSIDFTFLKASVLFHYLDKDGISCLVWFLSSGTINRYYGIYYPPCFVLTLGLAQSDMVREKLV